MRRINKIKNKLKIHFTNKLIIDTLYLTVTFLILIAALMTLRYIIDLEKDVSIKTTFYSEIRSQKPLYIKGFGTGSLNDSQEIQQSMVRFEVFELHRQEIEYQSNMDQLRLKQIQLEQQRLKKLALAKEVEEKRREQVSRSSEKHYRTLIMEATAYTAYCNTGCIGIVKTGKDVSNTIYHKGKNIVAVDPNVIPLYSILKVDYEGNSFYAYALDTGGDIKNLRLDILMESKSGARNFGRQEVKVNIIREGKGE